MPLAHKHLSCYISLTLLMKRNLCGKCYIWNSRKVDGVNRKKEKEREINSEAVIKGITFLLGYMKSTFEKILTSHWEIWIQNRNSVLLHYQ